MTTTREKIRESLAERGITSGWELAEHLGSKGAIFFIRGKDGWENAHAELRYTEDGRTRRSTYRPRGTGAVRQQCVEDAMADGWEHLGVDSWSKAPFSNCWLPSEDISRLYEEFSEED